LYSKSRSSLIRWLLSIIVVLSKFLTLLFFMFVLHTRLSSNHIWLVFFWSVSFFFFFQRLCFFCLSYCFVFICCFSIYFFAECLLSVWRLSSWFTISLSYCLLWWWYVTTFNVAFVDKPFKITSLGLGWADFCEV
jgi:hypothetical protein